MPNTIVFPYLYLEHSILRIHWNAAYVKLWTNIHKHWGLFIWCKLESVNQNANYFHLYFSLM